MPLTEYSDTFGLRSEIEVTLNPSSMTRRQVLETLAGLGAYSVLTGCSLPSGGGASSSPAAANSQPTPSGPMTTATLTVTASSIGTLPSNFAGLSYGKTELVHPFFSASNTNLIGIFKLLGPNILRIGGDPADKFTWMPNGKGQTYNQTSQSDVDAFAGFVKASGWKVLYTVNLGGSSLPVGSIGYTTPALAAAEVAYVSSKLGTSLYGIEIGNEPDAYGDSGSYYDGNWSLAKYEALWDQYRTAILASSPNVFITGPAGGHLATFAIPFTQDETKAKVGLLTDHYYKIPGTQTSGSIAKLLAYPDATLTSNLALMKNAQNTTGIPFRIAETNSVSAGGSTGVSDVYASALWVIDYLFDCAVGGAVGVNLHGGQGGTYAPIGDDEVNVTSIQPEFYGILLFGLVGTGTLYQTKVVAGSLNVTAFAVKTAAGLSLVINNKDTTQNLNLTVSLPQTAAYGNIFVLTQRTGSASTPDLAATSGITIQSATVGLDGTFLPGLGYKASTSGSTATCYVPAASAVLIQIY